MSRITDLQRHALLEEVIVDTAKEGRWLTNSGRRRTEREVNEVFRFSVDKKTSNDVNAEYFYDNVEEAKLDYVTAVFVYDHAAFWVWYPADGWLLLAATENKSCYGQAVDGRAEELLKQLNWDAIKVQVTR